MSQDIITMLQDYVLSGAVTLPEGETAEQIVAQLNSYGEEADDIEEEKQ
jgi:hypothetical protein